MDCLSRAVASTAIARMCSLRERGTPFAAPSRSSASTRRIASPGSWRRACPMSARSVGVRASSASVMPSIASSISPIDRHIRACMPGWARPSSGRSRKDPVSMRERMVLRSTSRSFARAGSSAGATGALGKNFENGSPTEMASIARSRRARNPSISRPESGTAGGARSSPSAAQPALPRLITPAPAIVPAARNSRRSMSHLPVARNPFAGSEGVIRNARASGFDTVPRRVGAV